MSSPAKAGDPVTTRFDGGYWMPRFQPKSALADFGSYQASESETSDFAAHDKTVIHLITDKS